jgi:signal transduction histidine kinase
MRGARIPDVAVPIFAVPAICGAAAIAVALLPRLELAYPRPGPRLAVATAVALIALLAWFLALGRLLLHRGLTELILACSLGALALSELAFVTVPGLLGRAPPDLSVWAAQAGSTVGAVLFAVTGVIPRRRLRRLRLDMTIAGAALAAALLLIAVLAVWFAASLPKVAVAAAARDVTAAPDLRGNVALAALEVVVAASFGVAAAGFLCRFKGYRDEFRGCLAIAAVLAMMSYLNYFFYPGLYSQFVSVGDYFLLCSFAVLLAGSAREIWCYWSELSKAAVLAERRRMARDLHDGLAQELAYLSRNLDSLEGNVDQQTRTRLRRAAGRAQSEVRTAIDALAAPRSQSVNVAIAQAVGEVATRDHVKLELDVAPGLRLPAARAEALTRIACEAVSNAARHSGDGQVSLSLRRHGPQVRLRVRDRGRGFDSRAPTGGFGLASMRDRASSVGGDLRISSTPGHGTEVEATL